MGRQSHDVRSDVLDGLCPRFAAHIARPQAACPWNLSAALRTLDDSVRSRVRDRALLTGSTSKLALPLSMGTPS